MKFSDKGQIKGHQIRKKIEMMGGMETKNQIILESIDFEEKNRVKDEQLGSFGYEKCNIWAKMDNFKSKIGNPWLKIGHSQSKIDYF